MRYHWGLGIGHTYSHHDRPVSISQISPDSPADCRNTCHSSYSSTQMGDHTGHTEDKVDDSGYSTDPESEAPSPAGSDLDSESESILGDFADIDGWDDLDLGACHGYEF